MTSKQRAYLKSLAMTMDDIFQIGKSSVTPELTAAVSEALASREKWQIHLQREHVHRLFKSLAKKLYCIKKEKTIKRKSFFLNSFLYSPQHRFGEKHENRTYGRNF